MAIKYPKLPEEKDRRVKIPKDQHEVIKQMYDDGMAIRAIAREYNVDKRLIQFILFPERQLAAKANREWKKYYDKDDRKGIMKEHRKYKNSIQGEEISKWRKATRNK
jgi:hypothetical protein